jgi:hypothetical protein
MEAITLRYTEALLRRAVRAFWWRTIGWTYVAAAVALLCVFSYQLRMGDRSWWVGVLGTVLGLAVTFGVALYTVHYRGTMGRLRRMRTPEATIELGEERFRVSSELGTAEVAWAAVTEVWSFPEFLLVFLSKAQFIALPTTDLGVNAREVILGRVRASGAKVA